MADYENNERVLPDNWVWTTLAEVTDTTRQRRHPQEYPELPYIGLENIESETMRLLGTQPTSELRSMADYFRPGDVLYTRLRPYLNKVYRPDFEGLCSSEFIIFRELENLNSKYLQYLLNGWDFVSYAMHKITGDRPRVDMGDLGDFPFPLAPLNEQNRIVDEIETQFSRLDTWLEVMDKLREQLPRLRASILKAAVEGRLVARNPNDESGEVLLQRILDERRRKWEEDYLAELEAKGKPVPLFDDWKAKYLEPEPPDIDGLPELPDGWVWVSLDQCSWHSGYGTSQRSDYDASGAPVLRIPNIVNGRVDLTDLKFATDSSSFDRAQALRPNDLLIIRTNGSKTLIGRSALVLEEFDSPHYYASYLIRYRLLPIENIPQWIATVWDSHFVRDWIDRIASTSAGQYNINITNLNKAPIPLPPSNQQALIAEDIAYRYSVIDRLLETIDVNVKRAERMRQSVLKRAFEGRLVEQDPNDEPAIELLERIHEELQRRTEEEKYKSIQRRERVMPQKANERKSLYETLNDASKPLSAHELFQLAGFNHETIDIFYEQLREILRESQNIQVWRENDDTFFEVIK